MFFYLWLRSISCTPLFLLLFQPLVLRFGRAAISGLHSRQQQHRQQQPLKTSCKQIEQQINKKKQFFLPSCAQREFYFQPISPSPRPPSTSLAAAEYLTSFQFLAATWFSLFKLLLLLLLMLLVVGWVFLYFSFSLLLLGNKPRTNRAHFGSQQICCLPFGNNFFRRVFTWFFDLVTLLTAPQLCAATIPSCARDTRQCPDTYYKYLCKYINLYITVNIIPCDLPRDMHG